jgi:replicative DNA helicase
LASLYNLELEKQFLSGTILHPDTRAQTSRIQPADLSTTNRVVLAAIDASLASGTPFSVFLLVDRLNSLGIKIADSIEPGIYVKALEGLAVGERAVEGIAKQLKNVTIRRTLHQTGQKLLKATEKDTGKKASELIAEATEIFNGQVNLLGGSEEDEPQDLYRTMDAFIDQESHFDSRSIPTPFPLYNDMYGWMDPGNIYCVAARAKTGKSTWVMSMLHQLALADGENRGFRGLLLDTELTREEVQSRLLSSMTGIKEFYIRHKIYRKNRAMRDKVEQARAELAPLWDHVDHIYIGGKSLEEQLSILRRWTHKHVIRTGKRGLAVLDYFKLSASGEFDAKNPRDIVLGKKVDAYKRTANELQIPVWALVQAGRQNEDTKEGAKVENGSVVAGSDMINSFCSNIYLLQKLTPQERAALGQHEAGGATHSLKNIYPRQLGPNELGKDCQVRYQVVPEQGKPFMRTVDNFLLYSFRSFHVSEVGTLKDVVDRLQSNVPEVQPPPEGDRPLL